MLQKMLSHPVLGITFTRDTAYAAKANRVLRRIRFERSAELQCEGLLDAGEEENWESLCAAIREALEVLSGRMGVLRIALPAPLVHTVALTAQEQPKNRREAEAIVRWRAASLSGTRRPYKVAVQYAKIGVAAYRLVGTAAPESLCEAIEQAVNMPVALTMLDSAAIWRWNFLPAPIRAGSGVLLDVLDDYWTLTAWDDSGWPHLVKSRWRQRSAGPEEISREVLRLLAARNEEEDGAAGGSCYFMAAAHEADDFRSALQATLGVSPHIVANQAGRGAVHGEAGRAALLAREVACAL